MKKNILTSEGMMEEIIIICTVSQGLWMKGSVQVYKSFFMMGSVILSWTWSVIILGCFLSSWWRCVPPLIKWRNAFPGPQPQVWDLSIELNIKKSVAWAWQPTLVTPLSGRLRQEDNGFLGWPGLHSETDLQQEEAPSPSHATASFSLGYHMSHCVLSLPYPFYVIDLVWFWNINTIHCQLDWI